MRARCWLLREIIIEARARWQEPYGYVAALSLLPFTPFELRHAIIATRAMRRVIIMRYYWLLLALLFIDSARLLRY